VAFINTKYFYIKIVFFTSLLSGCADTGGSHQLVGPPMSSSQASKFSDLLITVKPHNHIALSQTDTDRMTKLIVEDIKTNSPNRFKTINTSAPGSTALKASVAIKNYDEGSAFARFMMIGIGQIHIDADVTLADSLSNEKMAEYEVTKTFAWHGIYGAVTDIKDTEVGFCKAVADSILGKY
jgi:hypothetical protein